MVASGLLSLAGVALKKIGDYAVGYLNNIKDKTSGKEPPHPGVLAGPKHPVTGESLEGRRADSITTYKKGVEYGTQSKAYRPAYAALIPLILGAAWMAYLVVGSKAKPAEVQLSPAANNLVVGLFVFITAYSIFLVFFFVGKRMALKIEEKSAEARQRKKLKRRK